MSRRPRFRSSMCAMTAWNPAYWSASRTSSSTSALVLKMAMVRDLASKAPPPRSRIRVSKLRRVELRGKGLFTASMLLYPGQGQPELAGVRGRKACAEKAPVKLRYPARQRQDGQIGEAVARQPAAAVHCDCNARFLARRLGADADGA